MAFDGLPPCGPDYDWNVLCDTTAADIVVRQAGELTVVPLSLTLRVHLRRDQMAPLRAAGPLGRLIAFQAENQGEEEANAELGRNHAALPDDLLNFQHDPVACAAAIGWPCVTLQEERRIRPEREGDLLRFVDDDDGRPCRVGIDVDTDLFDSMWLQAVDAVHR
ncbi:MAG: nucleoside hydrolase [Acidimicrobiales bacterium]